MPTIEIVRVVENEVEIVRFDPPRLEVIPGEGIFFRNRDPKAEHWITKQGEAQDFWFRAPLAPFTAPPPDVSSEIVFQGVPSENDGVVVYVCSLHPGEQGEIVVVQPEL